MKIMRNRLPNAANLLLLVVAQLVGNAQTTGVDCGATFTTDYKTHPEKIAARAAFLKSIDSETWDDLRKNQSARACLFELFSLSDDYPMFSQKRTMYLSGSPVVAPERQPAIESAPPAIQTAAVPLSGTASYWTLGVSAPEQMINGTQSQQTFGGLLDLEVKDDKGLINDFDLTVVGSHMRTWKLHSPSIEVDSFEGAVKPTHWITASQSWGLYLIADEFFNSSLGVALEQSYGGGTSFYFRHTLPKTASGSSRSLVHSGLIDLRYFNERLYSSEPAIHLAGVHIDQKLSYRLGGESDRKKLDKYVISAHGWLNEMFNDFHAMQGYANVGISFPVKRSLCLSFAEEDYYLENVPAAHLRNYLSSKVTLAINHGSDSSDRCY
jgi:hypothetical protein